MAIDPSIYGQIKTPSYLEAISNGLAVGEQIGDRKNRIDDLANQRELRSQQVTLGRNALAAYPQQQAEAKRMAKQRHIQELSFGLSQGLDPQHGIDKESLIFQTMAEAKRRGLDNNDIQQLLTPMNSGKDDAAISAYYLNMANPQEAMKSRFEILSRKPEKPIYSDSRGGFVSAPTQENPQGSFGPVPGMPPISRDGEPLVPVMVDGKPVLLPRSQAAGKPPAIPEDTAATRLARERFEWEKAHPNVGGRGGSMSPIVQKEIISTDDEIQGSLAAKVGLKNALDLNDKAMGFAGAGALSTAGTLLPQPIRPGVVDATENLQNIIVSNVLPQLKSTFGSMPTEGERKVLIDIQGSVSKSPAVRKAIFERAQKAIDMRLKFAKEKAKRLREGSYFQSDEVGAFQIEPPPEVEVRPIKFLGFE